jgi:hypothetical protein
MPKSLLRGRGKEPLTCDDADVQLWFDDWGETRWPRGFSWAKGATPSPLYGCRTRRGEAGCDQARRAAAGHALGTQALANQCLPTVPPRDGASRFEQ